MDRPDIRVFVAAFENLLHEGEKLLTEFRRSGSDAFRRGEHEYVDWANQHCRALSDTLSRLREIRENFDRISRGEMSYRQETLPQPESRRVQETSRRRKGNLLPQSAYETPILVSLLEFGGRATTDAVQQSLWKRMKEQLGPEDMKPRASNPSEITWWNNAKWARNRLREQGFIAEGSPRGIWELTPAGREEARRRQEELLRQAREE